MLPAERKHLLYKLCIRRVALPAAPVDPASRVVLTVAIIIALLGIAKFVPRHQKRHALPDQYKHCRIAHLFFAVLQNRPLACRAFHAAVSAKIPDKPVLIVLAVFCIMLFVIAKQVGKRKPIVPGYKINKPEHFVLAL